MSPQTRALELLPNCFRNARLIATDMDGTLTRSGQFSSTLLATLEALAEAGWPVMIVTGRSAGWVSAVAHYLPVVGAIAENGGVFYNPDGTPQLLSGITDVTAHRQQLAHMFRRIQTAYPHLTESPDNPFRLTDWTFSVEGLSISDIEAIAHQCQNHGWSFTYSTVQCHIKPTGQDKATAVLQAIAQHFPQYDASQVVTIGDSLNDATLFNPDPFPCSVGVANIEDYRDRLPHMPCHITSGHEVEGFCELAQALLQGLISD